MTESTLFDQDRRAHVDQDPDGDFLIEEEYEDLRPESSTARKVLLVLLGIIIVMALAAAAGAWWLQRQIDPPGPPGAEVALTVPTGSSTNAIASLLEDGDVITSATLFRYYVRWKGGGEFQAGDYLFHEKSAFGDALATLEAGPAPPPSRRVTVPEGLTLPEITTRIVEQIPTFTVDALNGLISSGQIRSAYMPAETANLEGFIFPDTYEFGEGETDAGVLTKMVQQFDAVAAAEGINTAPDTVGLTPYEVVIVASLVQEEALIPEDAPKIARVIYNRLATGEPLGIDATFCYILAESPCSLSQSDLNIDSPYNTRDNAGLPPTPIAAPGRAALNAALHPADGDWIFYVLDAATPTDGDHFFTASSSEFARKKEECQAAGLC